MNSKGKTKQSGNSKEPLCDCKIEMKTKPSHCFRFSSKKVFGSSKKMPFDIAA